MFSLNNINNIKALYAFLESECDLKHNEHSKHLLLDVVMNNNTMLDKIKTYMNRNIMMCIVITQII